jgi:hypothetical protein
MKRHLLCHIYPFSNGKWRETVAALKHRWQLFDGRKVVAIGLADPREKAAIDPPELVKEAFGDDPPEFIERWNKPHLREVVTFVPLLQAVEPDREGVTFYCHGKGSSHGHDDSPCHAWRELMFHILLDYPELAACALEKFPLVGCFRRPHRFGLGPHQWHFSGTFYWIRNRDVFARNWRKVDRTWFGTESWPGRHFSQDEAGCLFMDNAGDLYDANYWRATVVPSFRLWRERVLSCGASMTACSPPNCLTLFEGPSPALNGQAGSDTTPPAKQSLLQRMICRLFA